MFDSRLFLVLEETDADAIKNMKNKNIKVFISVLFLLAFFLWDAKVSRAEVFNNVSIHCDNCAQSFSACGDRFGRTNVKWRACSVNISVNRTCTVVTSGPPTLWEVVSCSVVPTRTPTPIPLRLCGETCGGVDGACDTSKGLGCHTVLHVCRRRGCVNVSTCICPSLTPTPTVPVTPTEDPNAPTATPTPTDDPDAPTPTVDPDAPTPTVINPDCKCTSDSCTTACSFEGVTDPNTIKCRLNDNLFQSVPSDDNKADWCRRSKRTKGDANGDNELTNIDYMYYVSAVNGGKVPVTVNPDFNGDGEVGASDRDIIISSLNP